MLPLKLVDWVQAAIGISLFQKTGAVLYVFSSYGYKKTVECMKCEVGLYVHKNFFLDYYRKAEL
jgi:hypothetical protein